jgi:hypothetical protein
LAADASQTMAKINDPSNVLDAKANGIIIPNPEYAVQVEGAMKPIDATIFAMATPWNAPVRDTRVRRDEPKYLEPRELHLAFNKGAVNTKDKRYIGKQWIVVTGLIPYADQLAEYQSKFENALFTDPVRDTPRYAWYEIERAEVNPSKPNDPPQWKALDVQAIFGEADQLFAAERPDLVAKKFLDPNVSDFCPPLVGQSHGEEVAHLPEIPLMTEADKAAAAAPNTAAPAPVAPPPATGGNPRRRGKPVEPEPPAATAPGNKTAAKAEGVPFKLFRFFDYTVEYGKEYRYRVKLALENPNAGIVVRFLKNPDLARGETRDTGWSEPSASLTVPADFRLLASDAKVSASASIEPLARVMIVRWVPQEGAEVSQEFLKDRGSMLDFPGASAAIPIPGGGQTKQGAIDFKTDSLLVDVLGGEQVVDAKGRRFREPSETLVMNADGSLSLHNSVSDGIQYDANRHGASSAASSPSDDTPADGNPPPATASPFDFFNSTDKKK